MTCEHWQQFTGNGHKYQSYKDNINLHENVVSCQGYLNYGLNTAQWQLFIRPVMQNY